ncbi:hypothetical protein H2201_002375 [Coniosporium apollinis]|uniref:UBA domain-containing protein n=1 Tax=Coniosporium apollinis TaxID=61459 RepID=A0ABQ9P2F2_9PEZI|nr:hypothetical protein H2201_002375 [Coniosporium apollinis]
MPRNVIQDSDDDDDFLSPGKSTAHEATLPQPGNTRHGDGSSNEQRGTGSTDAIRREIQDAHRALVASNSPSKTTSTEHGDSLRDATSYSSQRMKRSASTAGFDLSSSSSNKQPRTKTVKTYGQSRQWRLDALEDANGAFDALREGKQGHNTSSGETANARKSQETLPSTDAPVVEDPSGPIPSWELPGSIQDDFAHHDPVAMFPDPSSTIPDNTMTQQRLIDEALSMHASVPFSEFHIPEAPAGSNSSIPWSAYIASQPGNGETGSKSSHPSNPSPQRSIDDISALTPSVKSKTPKSSKSTMPSPLKYSERIKRTKTTADVQATGISQHSLCDELSLSTGLLSKKRKNTATPSETETGADGRADEPKSDTKSSSELKNAAVSKLQSDDLISNSPKEQFQPRSSRTRSLRILETSNTNRPSDPLNSDDIAVGLPKERYQPRPSRSRSNPVLQEAQIDYSVPPEKAAKANGRAKRRKTTDTSLVGELVLSEAEKLERITAMGFSSSEGKKALRDHVGDLNAAVEWLANRSATATATGTQDSLADGIAVKSSRTSRVKEPAVTKKTQASVNVTETASTTITQESGNGQDPAKERTPTKRPGFVHIEIPSAKAVKQFTISASGSTDVNSEAGLPGNLEADTATSVSAVPEPEAPIATGKPPKGKRRKSTRADEAPDEADELDATAPKPKRSKSTQVESAESEIPPDPDPAPAPAPAMPDEPPKKRGRGRPPKAKAQEPAAELHNAGPDAEHAVPDQAPKPAEPALQDRNLNTVPAQQPGSMPTPQSTPPQAPQTVPAASTAQTPQKKGKATAESPTHHSPLSKGKKPYRVGLSRRARIPSLLRVVKK